MDVSELTDDEEITRRLRIVWMNHPPRRYVPRPIGGGVVWDVHDRKEDRLLNREEILAIEYIFEKVLN